ncbi:hypothetical protein [Bacillus sp. ISL-45]|uniref:hypothetical protein n=1 Tax=Bacillus sp. ISL-45 TaxID=2819128 RepID=UPI001BE90DA2|nr:hypothetical protein [Bacillus sp. ISL-45]MBT2661952.1 hypothetical protein [Bacillus sp. ISL-45]
MRRLLLSGRIDTWQYKRGENMEEYSFFNSVNGDRQYDADEFAKYFRQFLTTGLYHKNNVPSLKVTATTGLGTKVEPGSAFLEGYMYRNTTDKALTHDAGDATNPRIDRVVVRLDRSLAQRSIQAVVKKGTPATNPLPPALQRDDIIFEISLAQVRVNAGTSTINSVTDERLDVNVAGLVSSLITVPTDQFQAEWNKWFAGIQSGAPAMGGMKISVGTAAHASPTINDIWIDTR